MHLAIFMANTDESEFAHGHPLDGDKWRELLAPHCPECRFSVFSVKDGEFPDQPLQDFDGIIVTGSPASVNDPEPWLEQLFVQIHKAEAAKVPLMGACFGHQAIAKALGGKVDFNPGGGWRFGVTTTEIHTPAPWMDGQSGPILLNAAHEEQVTQAPEGARIFMGNDACPNGGFTIADHVFTTQYHPEITPHFMAALIEELADVKPAGTIKTARESMALTPENALFGGWIIQFFRRST